MGFVKERLFKEINYIQSFGSIDVNKDILKINPNWQKYFNEIELRNYQYSIVDIYHHSHLDFSGTFKNFICDDYISKKKENKFLTPEKYLNRYFIGEILILENFLFSKNSQEEYFEKSKKDLEISNFSKHFISVSDDLIYTFEKKGEKSYCFILLTGFEGKDENYQQDYFQGLYKFLKEDLPLLLNEPEINNQKAIQEQNNSTNNKKRVVEFYLNDFKDDGKISQEDFNILRDALLQFVNNGTFPHINKEIEFKGNKKKLGWDINSILKKNGLVLSKERGVLKFMKKNISKYKNDTEDYIYRLCTENTDKKKTFD